jgi:exodeoxyribonuclease-3
VAHGRIPTPTTIATWNVNGIRARYAQLAELVEQQRPDVVCLQELKATQDQVPELVSNLSGYWCYWHGARAYSGVALHLRKERFPDAPRVAHPDFDRETRIAHVELEDLVLVSVYVPNGGKDFPAKMAFLDTMTRWATELHSAGRRVVICGDVNIAREERDVHPKERKPHAIGQRPDERAAFARLLDTGRRRGARASGERRALTWWLRGTSASGTSDGGSTMRGERAIARLKRCTVLREFGTSDHGPVVARFDGV